MEYKNITLNGLKIPLPEESRVKDVIKKMIEKVQIGYMVFMLKTD